MIPDVSLSLTVIVIVPSGILLYIVSVDVDLIVTIIVVSPFEILSSMLKILHTVHHPNLID